VLQGRLNETQVALVAAIGPASCSNVGQCFAVPVGNKPCGGPASHLAASAVDTDVAQVEALAAEHRKIATRLNVLTGAVSDCALVEPPPLSCAAARCQFTTP
jgi:hypothetical protein